MTNFEPLLEYTSQDLLLKKLKNILYHPLMYSNYQTDIDFSQYSVVLFLSLLWHLMAIYLVNQSIIIGTYATDSN